MESSESHNFDLERNQNLLERDQDISLNEDIEPD